MSDEVSVFENTLQYKAVGINSYASPQKSLGTAIYSIKNLSKRGLVQKIINDTIEDFWPEKLDKPMMCCFDSMLGPTESTIMDYNLSLDYEIKDEYITTSIDSNSDETPFTIKSYKNEYLISYLFKISNPGEKRGRVTACSIVTKGKKKDFNIEEAEKTVSLFASELTNILQEYLRFGGKL